MVSVSNISGTFHKVDSNCMYSVGYVCWKGRERFATILLMRLTETVILWLSDDQTFWEEIEEGPNPLGPLGLQQIEMLAAHHICISSIISILWKYVVQVIRRFIVKTDTPEGRSVNLHLKQPCKIAYPQEDLCIERTIWTST